MGQFASGGSQFGGFSGVGTYVSTVTFTGGQAIDGTNVDLFYLNRGAAGNISLFSGGNYALNFGTNGAVRWQVTSAANAYAFLPGVDNSYAIGSTALRPSNGFFGTQVGTHDGTKFRGSYIATGAIQQSDTTVNTGNANNQLGLINKAGANTVIGQLYVSTGGAVAFSAGAATTSGQTYLAAGANQGIYIATTVAADAAVAYYVPLREGEIVDVLTPGAIGVGQYLIISAAGPAGTCDVSATPVAGRTIGMAIEAAGGAGLVTCRLMQTWA